jgi:hypothetical protein
VTYKRKLPVRPGSPWLSLERGFPIFCRQGEALAGQPCWPATPTSGRRGSARSTSGTDDVPATESQRRGPPWEHYGPGGDAFLVGLVVGEGDGLVIFSSTW